MSTCACTIARMQYGASVYACIRCLLHACAYLQYDQDQVDHHAATACEFLLQLCLHLHMHTTRAEGQS